jgi:hypothetical protein
VTLGGDGVVAQFKNMYDGVDINEKWFYQTTDGKNYILTASEDDAEDAGDCEAEPNRTIRHKNHIPKVMFLCGHRGTTRIEMECGMARLAFGQ